MILIASPSQMIESFTSNLTFSGLTKEMKTTILDNASVSDHVTEPWVGGRGKGGRGRAGQQTFHSCTSQPSDKNFLSTPTSCGD